MLINSPWKPRTWSLSLNIGSESCCRLRPRGQKELGIYTDDMAAGEQRHPLLGPLTSLPSGVSLAFSPRRGRSSLWYSTLT